jgi:hypothetical protein
MLSTFVYAKLRKESANAGVAIEGIFLAIYNDTILLAVVLDEILRSPIYLEIFQQTGYNTSFSSGPNRSEFPLSQVSVSQRSHRVTWNKQRNRLRGKRDNCLGRCHYGFAD